jgi:hypothetical protein
MSSLWETGVGNLPAVDCQCILFTWDGKGEKKCRRTLGKTGTQETGDLLDETIRSKEGIVLASKLLDELLVLVQLLEVISGHGIDAVVLGTVEIVLVTKNTAIKLVSLSPDYFPFLSVLVFSPVSIADSTYQMVMPGRGTVGSLMVPEKRLSRWGS